VNDRPGVQGKRFVSAVINGSPDTVVERAVYYSTPTLLFNAGAASLGVPIP